MIRVEKIIKCFIMDDWCLTLIIALLHMSQAMLDRNSDKFPMFPNLRPLSLKRCFLDDECDCDMGRKLEDLGSFLQNAPCLEKLTLWCCMVHTAILSILPCLPVFATVI
jgi:hypothetical protein